MFRFRRSKLLRIVLDVSVNKKAGRLPGLLAPIHRVRLYPHADFSKYAVIHAAE
jgi:hypothetical protein